MNYLYDVRKTVDTIEVIRVSGYKNGQVTGKMEFSFPISTFGAEAITKAEALAERLNRRANRGEVKAA